MKLNQRLAGLGAALAFSVLARAAHAGDIPSFVETRAGWRSSDITVVDRHGAPLQQVRVDHTVRRLRWVALSDVSPALTRALLDTEDKRFYEHSGVDWQALGSAAIGNSTAKNVAQRGASTLTMQLAGLLDPALKPTQARRNVGQKWDQIRAAQHIERSWKKSEILEAYVNLVTFRGELQGIDALARGLFAKAPHGLNAREAALAAALIRAPNASAGQVSQRACWVLQGQALAAECNGLASYTELVLGRAYVAKLSHNDAPHYARNLLAQSPAVDANTVRSTLDAPLQRAARLALKRHLLELSGRNVEDGAVLVLDNETGESLAWIGSSGDLSRAAQVDGVMALRQAGSTLKPFLYAQAISERRINAATLLDDAPIELATANGLYIPRNYSTQFRGVVTVRNALAGSLNIPAVRTLVMTGVEPFAQTLRGVGLSSIAQAGDYYGYSLALGSADVTLYELTHAYRKLGMLALESSAPMKKPTQRASSGISINPAAAWIVADMLADRNARSLAFGNYNVLETPFWSAVKTGTSKDMRDNWAVGFSKRYTVGVWVGNASGLPMHDVSGVSGAAPIWKDVMLALHARSSAADRAAPPLPSGVVEREVRFSQIAGSSDIEAPRRDFFLADTATAPLQSVSVQSNKASTGSPIITYPTQGTLIALDPDMPPARQRVPLTARYTQGTATLYLNGKPVREPRWFPLPGKHKLELKDTQGVVLDTVRFEVRGAQMKGAGA